MAQKFTGREEGPWERMSPEGSRGRAPVGSLGDSSGVTIGWLLRLVTGAPLMVGAPDSSRVLILVINFSVCLVLLNQGPLNGCVLVLLSNCYIIIYCIVWFQVQPLMVVFQLC